MGSRARSRGAAPFAVAAIVVGWLALGPRARRRRGHRPPAPDRRRHLAPADRPRPARAARHPGAGRDARRARDPARVLGVAAARPLHLPAAQRAGVRAAGPRPRLPGRRARRDARPRVTRRPWIPLLALAVATAWAIGGLILPEHARHARRRALPLVRGFILRGRTPGVYAAAFALTAALELYGTHLGTWAWAAHDPTGAPQRGQPAQRDPGRLLLARLLRARARAARLRAARARAGRSASDLLQRRHREAEAAQLIVVVLG